MSIKIMNLVWESAPYKGNTLLTLLALADWSNDEGYSWPNLQTLADKSRQSIRSVQYAIEQLSEDGLLVAQLNQGRNTRNEFLINTQKLQVSKTCKTQQENTQFGTGKHAKRNIAIRKNHHEPSVNQTTPNPAFQAGDSNFKLRHRDHTRIARWIEREGKPNPEGVSRISGWDWKTVVRGACLELLIPFEDAVHDLPLMDEVWAARLELKKESAKVSA